MEAARRAQPSDAPRLVTLCRAALVEIAGKRGGPQLARDLLAGRPVAALVEGAMGRPDALVVAGEWDAVVLGVGVITAAGPPGPAGEAPDAPLAKIEALYVEPGVRAVGVGEAMMDLMVAWATRRGCSGIDAVALPGSREAKAFFETNGLVARALVMHRSLTPDPADPGT